MSENNITVALADWRLPVTTADAVQFCAQHKIQALQVDFGGPGRAPLLSDGLRQQRLIEASVEHNVQLIGLAANQLNDIGLSLNFNIGQTLYVQKLITGILDVAVRLSVPLVFFPSFRKGAIKDVAGLKRSARILRWASQQASDRGLLLANENDLSPQLSMQLVETVNADNFRLVFDSYNPVKAGYIASDYIKQLPSYFSNQIHIKDGSHQHQNYTALGAGDADLENTLSNLSAQSWVHYYVIENDYRHVASDKLHNDINWLSQKINGVLQ